MKVKLYHESIRRCHPHFQRVRDLDVSPPVEFAVFVSY